MGTVSVEEGQVWGVANWAFEMLILRAQALATSEADLRELLVAEAVQGLSLEGLGRAQAVRIAKVLLATAIDVRQELLDGPPGDPRDGGFAIALVELVEVLESFINDAAEVE